MNRKQPSESAYTSSTKNYKREVLNRVHEDAGPKLRSVFLTQWKNSVMMKVIGIVTLLVTIGSIFIGAVVWIVDNKVEALRVELVGETKAINAKLAALQSQIGTNNAGTNSRTSILDGDIGENDRRISANGERIARLEGTLTGATERLNQLHVQMMKNTEAILKSGGTPDIKVGGTPD